jgi:hypothetical protein
MIDIVEMLKKKLDELKHAMPHGSHDEDEDNDYLSDKNKRGHGLSIFSVSLSSHDKQHEKPSEESAVARNFPSEINRDPITIKEIAQKLQSKVPSDVILSTFDEKNSPKPGMEFLDVNKHGKNSGEYALKLTNALNSLAEKEGSQRGELSKRMKLNSASMPFLDNELTIVMDNDKKKEGKHLFSHQAKSKKNPLDIDVLKSLLNNL